MNRLQKKCFVASASIHGLLVVIVLVGPGFMSSNTKSLDDLPFIECPPDVLVDRALYGGGNPNAKPPPPVAPPAQPVRQTAPPPEPKAQPKQRDPEPVEPATITMPRGDSASVLICGSSPSFSKLGTVDFT